ncbi:MAG: bifunctional helix-turn-helix transcriptional regulator/GNAT family N-acetyltransferase [Flavitalea sp.]
MNIYEQAGKVSIGSRLRLLTEQISEDATAIYQLYGTELLPKWFPVFRVLQNGDETVTGIAQQIGHSHPSVSKTLAEMTKAGVVKMKTSKMDARKSLVSLSPKGIQISKKIQVQYEDVNAAVEDILAQTRNNLWEAIGEWQYLLGQKKLLKWLEEQRKKRESAGVSIISYSPKYQKAFRDLNEEWISKYFKMESSDYKALDNPNGYILKPGGYIFVALLNNEPVGVCALIKMNDVEWDFELAKMAVSPAAQGKNIGYLLGRAALVKAKEAGASKVYLESNTVLAPAINLYNKLGFRKISGYPTPYERCNIQMEIEV